MEAGDVATLIEQLVEASFPAIRGVQFSVSVNNLPDCIAEVEFSLQERIAHVWMDREDLARMTEEALTGCLAHELCHIEADLKRGLPGVWLYDPLYWRIPWVLAWEERNVDRAAIRKGYGKELFALQIYHDQHYEAYDKSDGLTLVEIEEELAKISEGTHRT